MQTNQTLLRRARRSASIVIAAAVYLLTVCAPGAPASRQLTVVSGAGAPTILDTLDFVAQKAHFFEKESLDVSFLYAAGAPMAQSLVAANKANIGKGSIVPLISGYDRGIRGKFFFQFVTRFIYTIAVPVESPIANVTQLRGKRIGVPSMGSFALVTAKSALQSAGISSDAAEFLPVGIGAQALAALKSDKVDALATFTSDYAAIEASTGQKFRQFSVPELAKYWDGAYFASDDYIKQNPDVLTHYARAIAKAVVFCEANPAAALQIFWDSVPDARPAGDKADATRRGMIQMNDFIASINGEASPNLGFLHPDSFAGLIKFVNDINNTTVPAEPTLFMTNAFIKAANSFDIAAVQKLARNWH